MAAAAVAAATIVAQESPPLRSVPGPGVVRWHFGEVDVVALGGGGWRSTLDPERTLEYLRRAGITSPALIVLTDRSVPGAVVDAVVSRHRVGAVLGPGDLSDPPRSRVAVVPPGGLEVELDSMVVAIVRAEDRYVVEARPVRRDSG